MEEIAELGGNSCLPGGTRTCGPVTFLSAASPYFPNGCDTRRAKKEQGKHRPVAPSLVKSEGQGSSSVPHDI
jgi:hypothetical protein